MNVQVTGLLDRVMHRQLGAGRRENDAGIADLAARFAVERRLVDDYRDLVAGGGLDDPLAAAQDGQRNAFGGFGLITEKFGCAEILAQAQPDRFGRRLARTNPATARLRALTRHRRLESVDRYPAALPAQHVFGQIERKAIGIVELESGLAGERFTGAESGGLLFEQ